ncbi:MAG: DUF2608 domain-containing protein [Parachlamydiaceae bacterium]
MLKKILSFLLLLPLLLNSEMIDTNSILDAIQHIDQETWVLIDIDNTLFEAQQALGHANWFYDEVEKRMNKGMTREAAIKEIYPDWVKTQNLCQVKPLEENFVSELLKLQEYGIIVMGLTHRQPCLAKSTLKQILSLGFNFSTTAPSSETFIVPAGAPTLYKQGVLFVGDDNKKGEVFLTFCSMIDFTPKKVVFIDDKRNNIEDLENTFSSLPIEYIGVHYTAIDHSNTYSKEIAELQHHYLSDILSNEAARLLIDNGLHPTESLVAN